jgi:hypothetical protein
MTSRFQTTATLDRDTECNLIGTCAFRSVKCSTKRWLMFRLSRDLMSRRPIEPDSQEWYEFSARKACFRKRTAIRERTDNVRHHTVVF